MARPVRTDLDFGSLARVRGLPAPTLAGDAATKAYADALKAGFDFKDSVRAASTASVDISSPGAAIDGVSLSNGDRVLLKNQTAPAENGIYIWNGASSAMTRATDADENAEVTPGLAVAVSEGTSNADTLWLLTTNAPITVGVTSLAFSQLGTVTSAGTGLTKSGQAISLDTPVSVSNGGTGSGTAAGARSNLGATGKVASTITGDGAATTFNVAHNLGSLDVVVAVYELATEDEVIADVRRIDTNTVRIGFASPPANGAQFRAVVVG